MNKSTDIAEPQQSLNPLDQINDTPFLLYVGGDENIKVRVLLHQETVWLSQKQMAELFQKDIRTINEHIGNVYAEGELIQESTIRKFRMVQIEGSRQVQREVAHYNLDVIISVGYRVKSLRATQFRIWATQILKKFIKRGIKISFSSCAVLIGCCGVLAQFIRSNAHHFSVLHDDNRSIGLDGNFSCFECGALHGCH